MHLLPSSAANLSRSGCMNLSFAGCGFLGIYHVGVASCFREYAPHVFIQKIAGASAGSLSACALICNVPLGQSTTDVLRVAVQARSRALGPFHPGFDINQILYDGLSKILPEDCHILCNGRLHVSVTRVSDGENVILTQFDDKEDVIQALLCSCFIPVFSGIIPPKFHGVAYIDGGFSDNLPVLDNNTVTVSPFAGESDICPRDNSIIMLQMNLANMGLALSYENVFRLVRVLFPPDPEILTTICQQGFNDALMFLQRHNLISCTRCLAIQTRFIVAESESLVENESSHLTTSDHAYDDCIECRYRRQISLLDSLPESIVQAIQEACDQMNKGVINWLFRHRPMKLLSIITIPYVLPIDIAIVIFYKIWQFMPMVQQDVQKRIHRILALATNMISNLSDKSQQYRAKFSYKLALTEFNYSAEDTVDSCSGPIALSSRKNSKHRRFVGGRSKSLEEVRTKVTDRRAQRKSYAGQPSYPPPQRVIQAMNFGFTVNLSPTVATSTSEQRNVMEAYQTLAEENSELNAIEISNKVLNWERQHLGHYHTDLEPQNAETIERILRGTSRQDSIMAFYYMDENNQVNVTEIFNVSDDPEDEVDYSGRQRSDSESSTDAESNQDCESSEDSAVQTTESIYRGPRVRDNLRRESEEGDCVDFCISLDSSVSDTSSNRKLPFRVLKD